MEKTKSFKTWHLILLLAMVLFAIGHRIYGLFWTKATVTVAGQELRVLVADTYKHRVQGWSDHKDMGKYEGMLFVFPDKGRHGMVMRDMYFPLDIVWIDGTKIIDIAPNLPPVPPEANVPEEQLLVYQARASSTLVLELPAGFMEQTGLKIGDEVEIVID